MVVAALLGLLIAQPGPGVARLLKDVTTGPPTYPTIANLHVAVEDHFLFVAWPQSGCTSYCFSDPELWQSDGSPEGTKVARYLSSREQWPDHIPGPEDMHLSQTTAGPRVYFFSGDRYDNYQSVFGPTHYLLWRSDGTGENTRIIDRFPSAYRFRPPKHFSWGNIFYYTRPSTDAASRVEALWANRGEASYRIAELGDPSAFFGAGDFVYFRAGPTDRRAFFRSDGTPERTEQIEALPFTEDSTIHNLQNFDDRAIVTVTSASGESQLWGIHTPPGVAPSAELLPFPATPQVLGVLGSLVLMSVATPTRSALWVTDGTAQGTRQLQNEEARGGVVYRGALYFERHGRLWRTDGTAEGTEQALGLPLRSFPVVHNDLLLFAAEDEAGEELWRSDGTPSGTARLLDFVPGPKGASPRPRARLGRMYLFTVQTSQGAGWLFTDGSSAGTLGPMLPSDAPRLGGLRTLSWGQRKALLEDEDQVIWSLSEDRRLRKVLDFRTFSERGTRLIPAWTGSGHFYAGPIRDAGFHWTDGSTVSERIEALRDIYPQLFASLNGRTILQGLTADRPRRLSRSFYLDKEQAEPISELDDVDLMLIHPKHDNHVYLWAGNNLLRWDGQSPPQPLFRLRDYWRITSQLLLAHEEAVYVPIAYTSSVAMWPVEPRPGPPIVYRHPPATHNHASYTSFYSTKHGLYLTRIFEGHQRLFKLSSGQATDLYKFFHLPSYRPLEQIDDDLYGISLDRRKLFRVRAGAVEALLDLEGEDALLHRLFSINGRLAMVVSTPQAGRELWFTDGTKTGTERLDIYPGFLGSHPSDFQVLGTKLLFVADHPDFGEEYWLSDGTAAGTRLAADAVPGPAASVRHRRTTSLIGRYLVFAAYTPRYNTEPWSLDLRSATCGDGDLDLWEDCDPLLQPCCNADCTRTAPGTPCGETFCEGPLICAPSGACAPANTPDHSDGVACTEDRCDEAARAITHTPQDARCLDDDPCTAGRCDLELGCQPERICASPIELRAQGCSCDSARAPKTGFLWLSVLIAVFLRRRRSRSGR